MKNHCIVFLLLTLRLGTSSAFVPQSWGRASARFVMHETTAPQEHATRVVSAPLKFIGPYPALALRFPNLATTSQKSRNVTGISMDFILDTAANVNTINAQVAQELKLPVVGESLPGVSTAGALSSGATYLLGDAQLEGMIEPQQQQDEEEPFVFMTGLTASALPIAHPAAAGLLSLAFLQSFPNVEFVWGKNGTTTPTVSFMDQANLQGRERVALQRMPVTQLPFVTMKINGMEMPALLDTGSPITVMNAKAAQVAGISTVSTTANPFAAMANRFQAGSGNVLTIMGANGKPVQLVKTRDPVQVQLMGNTPVDFGQTSVYVGDLPGLAALNGLGIDSPPAVVLGMDVLQQRRSMLLRAQENEVWFD